MAAFLLLIVAAIALGILGAVIKGLIYLLVAGAVLFLADFLFLGFWLRGRGRRPQR